ncbi:MAG: serine hydrolase [Woeseiaceae bacterium]|nr:serine hydrolase [Woeseiaceae bacterium]
MSQFRMAAAVSALLVAGALTSIGCADESTQGKGSLSGVWVAEAEFGPRLHGPVTLHRVESGWIADIQSETAPVVRTSLDTGSTEWSFAFRGQGRFVGLQAADDSAIVGHWIQPPGRIEGYPFATPVSLVPAGPDDFAGTIRPFMQRVSLNIPLIPDAGRTASSTDRYRTYLRNPERNLGWWFPIESASFQGNSLTFYDGDGERLATAEVVEQGRHFTMLYPRFGRTMVFTRRPRHDAPGFYPIRDPSPVEALVRPAQLDDGWQTAAPSVSGLDEQPLLDLLNSIRTSEPNQLREPYIHALLIAHQGKLVFESYFHGYDREQTHDSRSAGKSLASILLGSAIHSGAIERLDMPVYSYFGGVDAYANPDPRKARMTLRHLVTMSPGFDCDDDDYDSPGNEGVMQDQDAQPDWYTYTLDLPMRNEPGDADIYCTAGINLLGGVISKATGQSLPAYFDDKLAVPLQMGHYQMNLSPMERGYMGGGIRLRPRDFIKLGQLYLDGGVWNGTRIVSEDWVRESRAAHSSLNEEDDYGYAWWRRSFRVDDRDIETYYASGNGGQLLFVVPTLDLVVLIQAGNYSDGRTRSEFRDRFMKDSILPAALASN